MKAPSSSTSMLQHGLWYNLQTLWLFTASDLFTFILPEFFLGFCGLLTNALIPRTTSLDTWTVLQRSAEILAWNWLNTFIFCLANQGSKAAVKEDAVNKPWRPIAAGRITVDQTRDLLITIMPIFGALCYVHLGGFQETSILICLTWAYNDLGASDKDFVVRNLVIAAAYFFYGKGSLQVAMGPHRAPLPQSTIVWLLVISGIIFLTMSVQDLKDQSGDTLKGRRTAPLILGESLSRWSIAIPIVLSSFVCCRWWNCHWLVTTVCAVFGIVVASRTILLQGFEADKLTWKLWAIWLLCIYGLPLVGRP